MANPGIDGWPGWPGPPVLAVQNVEIVLFPFAADPPEGLAAWAGPALRARRQENGVYGIACNYVGRVAAAGVQQIFPGGAMIIGPRGEVVAQQAGGDLLLHEIRSDDLRAARAEPAYLFRYRRPLGPLPRRQFRAS